jgi:hypothetical protein|tara:strand:- start:138 stop:389 length:252 start_codon:yes stop_codon:yes gene_type:complete
VLSPVWWYPEKKTQTTITMKGYMKYKYHKQPTNKQWTNAPTFNVYQIQTAVDIAIGDDGMRGNQVVEILEHERKEASSSKLQA